MSEVGSDEYMVKYFILFTSWKDGEKRTDAGWNLIEKMIEDIGLSKAEQIRRTQSQCKGWVIDSKLLTYRRITEADWKAMMWSGVTIAENFEALDKFCESIKHRFGSKKFGL